MVNKPKGYICSSVETQEGRGKRAIDLLEPWLAEWIKRNEKNVRVPNVSLSLFILSAHFVCPGSLG